MEICISTCSMGCTNAGKVNDHCVCCWVYQQPSLCRYSNHGSSYMLGLLLPNSLSDPSIANESSLVVITVLRHRILRLGNVVDKFFISSPSVIVTLLSTVENCITNYICNFCVCWYSLYLLLAFQKRCVRVLGQLLNIATYICGYSVCLFGALQTLFA